jgi:hypothetical protein
MDWEILRVFPGKPNQKQFSYIKSQKSEISNIATLQQNGQLHSDTKTIVF